jgi:hypothetical protein
MSEFMFESVAIKGECQKGDNDSLSLKMGEPGSDITEIEWFLIMHNR